MAYPDVYLDEVVETQGKLFDFVAQSFRDKDTEDFIVAYMNSRTRGFIDSGRAYVMTKSARELWEDFVEKESYELKPTPLSKVLCPTGSASFTPLISGSTMFPVRKRA